MLSRLSHILLFVTLATASASTVAPCGFIGLGIMGEGMANNLLKAGTPLHVWSRDKAVCEQFVELAAKQEGYASVAIEDSPAAVVAACARTYLMLSAPVAKDWRLSSRCADILRFVTRSGSADAALRARAGGWTCPSIPQTTPTSPRAPANAAHAHSILRARF